MRMLDFFKKKMSVRDAAITMALFTWNTDESATLDMISTASTNTAVIRRELILMRLYVGLLVLQNKAGNDRDLVTHQALEYNIATTVLFRHQHRKELLDNPVLADIIKYVRGVIEGQLASMSHTHPANARNIESKRDLFRQMDASAVDVRLGAYEHAFASGYGNIMEGLQSVTHEFARAVSGSRSIELEMAAFIAVGAQWKFGNEMFDNVKLVHN